MIWFQQIAAEWQGQSLHGCQGSGRTTLPRSFPGCKTGLQGEAGKPSTALPRGHKKVSLIVPEVLALTSALYGAAFTQEPV